MQSSLVKRSAISLSKKAASSGSSFDSRLYFSSCFHTESPGHPPLHNPLIMSTPVAQHLSAGTSESMVSWGSLTRGRLLHFKATNNGCKAASSEGDEHHNV